MAEWLQPVGTLSDDSFDSFLSFLFGGWGGVGIGPFPIVYHLRFFMITSLKIRLQSNMTDSKKNGKSRHHPATALHGIFVHLIPRVHTISPFFFFWSRVCLGCCNMYT